MPPVAHAAHAAAVALALAAAGGALGAQQSPAPDSTRRDSVAPALRPAAPAAPAVTLPGVVTVGRAPEVAGGAPVAVTRIGEAELRRTAGYGLQEALALVPGVIAQARAGSSDVRLTIRGFGARGAGDRSNAGTSRGVRVLVDGIPETEPDGRTSFDLVDMAAATGIEVVRSNAGSLWGNAAGGVVSITTAPRFDAPFAEGELQVGSFGVRRLAARTGAPVGDARLAAALVSTGSAGWRDHADARRLLANVSARAPLGTRSLLSLHATAADNAFEIPGPLTRAELERDPTRANATYERRRERRRNRLGRLGATLDHDAGTGAGVQATLYVAPKVLQRSERNTFRDFTRHHAGGSVVVRRLAAVRGLPVALLAGADEQWQGGAALFYSLTPDAGRGDTLRANRNEGTNGFGAFAQADVALTNAVRVTAGVRRDLISYAYRDFLLPQLSADRTFARWTPKLGVVARLSDRATAYASAGGGVEAPAGNETDPPGTFGQDTVTGINPALEPIGSTTYEAGVRRAMAAGDAPAVAYDAALYLTDVRNEIVPYAGGRFYATAGRARRTGFEAGAQARLPAGLAARGAVTLSRHRYLRYAVDSVHYGRPGRFADYAGNRVVGVPAATGGAALAWSPGAHPLVRADLAVQASGPYWADDANQVRVPGFATLDVGVALARGVVLGGGLALDGWLRVTNILDRRYAGSAFLNPDIVGGEPVAFEPGAPRGWAISATLGRR